MKKYFLIFMIFSLVLLFGCTNKANDAEALKYQNSLLQDEVDKANEEAEKANQELEQLKAEQQAQQLSKDNSRAELNNCLDDAQKHYEEWGAEIIKMADECKAKGNGSCSTISAFTEALQENSVELQQNKDNCFKQFPQN